MLQYDTRLLDRSRNFNRAGAIGQNIGRTIKDIVAASRQRRKHGIAQQAFQGYNPQTDPEGINYRQRQKDYYNALRSDWRTSSEGHQGLQAVQQQEIEERNRRVQEEKERLALDNTRIQNKLQMIQYDQFRNDMLDETLTHMAQSPEKYEAGMSELQKYFATELQQIGLPETFNKDAQAKILMRRGVSKKTKALNDMKLKELQALKDRARKIGVQDRDYRLRQRAQDITEKRYKQDYDAKMAKVDKSGTKKYTDDQKKDIYKYFDRVDSDPIVKKINDGLYASSAIREMISGNSKLSPSVIEVQMPRLMGEVGNMAQQEQTKWRGSQAWGDQFKRLVIKASTGHMTQNDKNEIINLLNVFDANMKDKGAGRVDMFTRQASTISGIDSASLKEVSKHYYEPYKHGERSIHSQSERIETDDQGNRYRFLGGDDTDPKNWELIR